MIRRPPKPTLFPYPTLFRSALAGLLAAAIVPLPRAVLSVNGFDTSSDEAYLKHLYIPGLRRAGDMQTAASHVRGEDRKSTRLNSSHGYISYAVFCLKKKTAP